VLVQPAVGMVHIHRCLTYW